MSVRRLSRSPALCKSDRCCIKYVANGSWNRAFRTGHKMVRARMQNGVPTGEYEDFLTGFKLGMSRLTYGDLFAGRRAALARAAREYADTCARFGTDTDDLAPYRVHRRRP